MFCFFVLNGYFIVINCWARQAKEHYGQLKRQCCVCRIAKLSPMEGDLLIPFVRPRFTADKFFPSWGGEVPIRFDHYLTQLVTQCNFWRAKACASKSRALSGAQGQATITFWDLRASEPHEISKGAFSAVSSQREETART